MANPNRDAEYLGKLQDYYADYRNIPSYSAIGELLGMASKSAVSALVKRLTLAGFIEVTPDKRLAPTKRFFERELADFNLPAGLPAAANDAMSEAISLDEFLMPRPASSILVKIKGDSMMEAGIFDGDIAVVEKRHAALVGDIVVAIVDNEYTLKELGKDKTGYFLIPHNSDYSIIRPEASLEIFGVMVGLVRKYR
ncbi:MULTISPECIES: LexA family transcriptional regulator [Deefgea]|uniref:LexA family transcriptional regulator n=1 Tax=Deefgea piscis TaxID=2739061 RepID=A0A6M8T0X3_9NEIS|nr:MULTISPECIES: S24 family peptidase [Deefgea]MBM5575637.1 LexA family transcriptional regulator [Deefgea sp. CFH1-16]QKJ67657.1 LexA family transcriptional regulator [Deefgea piscis]